MWRSVVGPGRWQLHDGELAQLEEVCRLRDSAALLQAALDDEGIVTTSTRGTTRSNPVYRDLLATRTAITAMIRALKLPDPDAVAVPDATAKSTAARAAVRARWGGSSGRPGSTRRRSE